MTHSATPQHFKPPVAEWKVRAEMEVAGRINEKACPPSRDAERTEDPGERQRNRVKVRTLRYPYPPTGLPTNSRWQPLPPLTSPTGQALGETTKRRQLLLLQVVERVRIGGVKKSVEHEREEEVLIRESEREPASMHDSAPLQPNQQSHRYPTPLPNSATPLRHRN